MGRRHHEEAESGSSRGGADSTEVADDTIGADILGEFVDMCGEKRKELRVKGLRGLVDLFSRSPEEDLLYGMTETLGDVMRKAIRASAEEEGLVLQLLPLYASLGGCDDVDRFSLFSQMLVRLISNSDNQDHIMKAISALAAIHYLSEVHDPEGTVAALHCLTDLLSKGNYGTNVLGNAIISMIPLCEIVSRQEQEEVLEKCAAGLCGLLSSDSSEVEACTDLMFATGWWSHWMQQYYESPESGWYGNSVDFNELSGNVSLHAASAKSVAKTRRLALKAVVQDVLEALDGSENEPAHEFSLHKKEKVQLVGWNALMLHRCLTRWLAGGLWIHAYRIPRIRAILGLGSVLPREMESSHPDKDSSLQAKAAKQERGREQRAFRQERSRQRGAKHRQEVKEWDN